MWNKSTTMGNETFYFEWGQTRLKSLSVPLAVQLIIGRLALQYYWQSKNDF